MVLVLKYSDGQQTAIVSTPDNFVVRAGPVIYDHLFHGLG